MEDEEEMKNLILKKQNDLIEESINQIKSKRYGRQISVFKMKDIIAGSKKPKQEAHAVLDSKTGENQPLGSLTTYRTLIYGWSTPARPQPLSRR